MDACKFNENQDFVKAAFVVFPLQNFFQNFFQAPQTALNGDPHDLFMDTFCPGNILFGHAENEMGVDTFRLLIRQPGNGGMEFLHSHLTLVQLMRRKCNEKSLMLNAVIPIKGVLTFPKQLLRHCI